MDYFHNWQVFKNTYTCYASNSTSPPSPPSPKNLAPLLQRHNRQLVMASMPIVAEQPKSGSGKSAAKQKMGGTNRHSWGTTFQMEKSWMVGRCQPSAIYVKGNKALILIFVWKCVHKHRKMRRVEVTAVAALDGSLGDGAEEQGGLYKCCLTFL